MDPTQLNESQAEVYKSTAVIQQDRFLFTSHQIFIFLHVAGSVFHEIFVPDVTGEFPFSAIRGYETRADGLRVLAQLRSEFHGGAIISLGALFDEFYCFDTIKFIEGELGPKLLSVNAVKALRLYCTLFDVDGSDLRFRAVGSFFLVGTEWLLQHPQLISRLNSWLFSTTSPMWDLAQRNLESVLSLLESPRRRS